MEDLGNGAFCADKVCSRPWLVLPHVQLLLDLGP